MAVGVESLIGLAILHRRWGLLEVRRVVGDLARSGLACAAMALAITVGLRLAPEAPLAELVLAGGLRMVVYFVAAAALGIREVRSLPLTLLRSLQPQKA